MPKSTATLHPPKLDDRPLWNVLFGLWGYPAALVAHDLKLFELLAEKPLTLDEVCTAKSLARRPAEALLAVCTSLGLVARRGEHYALTPVSRECLLPSSPFYFGWQWAAWLPQTSTTYSPESLREAVLTDKPQGGSMFAFMGRKVSFGPPAKPRNRPSCKTTIPAAISAEQKAKFPDKPKIQGKWSTFAAYGACRL